MIAHHKKSLSIVTTGFSSHVLFRRPKKHREREKERETWKPFKQRNSEASLSEQILEELNVSFYLCFARGTLGFTVNTILQKSE